MRLTGLFPEIYRYKAQDAGRVRLISGLAAALALCGAVGYSVYKTTASWQDYFTAVTNMQFNLLVFYGALCAAKSVTQEKSERTWDFQRLTPLSSFELAGGKFLGAPVYAWFLFACMVPASLLPPLMTPEVHWEFFSRYLLGLSCALLSMAAGLLASAYDDTGGSGMGHLSGPLVGVAGAVLLNVSFRYANLGTITGPPLDFYGAKMGPTAGVFFMAASLLAFAGWAFLGARYRIGRDLLERKRAWRLPAFLLFLAWYAAGLEHGVALRGYSPVRALILAVLAAYLAAFLSFERREYWRRWLRGGDPARRLDEAPGWIKAAASVFLVAALLWLAYVLAIPATKKAAWQLYLILPLFLLRDLMFLQWCRFSSSRRPEMMALAYIALAYFLPVIVMAPTGLNALLPLFVPYAREASGLFANLAGPLAQAVLMGYILRVKVKQVLEGKA